MMNNNAANILAVELKSITRFLAALCHFKLHTRASDKDLGFLTAQELNETEVNID